MGYAAVTVALPDLASVWNGDQLKKEIDDGYWALVAASPKLVLKAAHIVAEMLPDEFLGDYFDDPATLEDAAHDLDGAHRDMQSPAGGHDMSNYIQDRCSALHTELCMMVGISS